MSPWPTGAGCSLRQGSPPQHPMTTNGSQQITQKLWNYASVLRADGLSYGDYVEQLTYLLFLKMAHERTQPPLGEAPVVPPEFGWPSLLRRDGAELEEHYRRLLEELAKQPGMLGLIFRKSQNKVQDPAKLRCLIADLIDRETWTALSADVKGDAYEGLLEKNAQDVKGGAGQYFTPRPLIQAIVDVMVPRPGESIGDPACGTGGFLLAAHDSIIRHHPNLDVEEKRHLKLHALHGVDIVDGVTRLCAMNLLLHGIGPNDGGAVPPVRTDDSLRADPGERFDLVLTNPPFGRKSSVLVIGADGEQEREALSVVREDCAYGELMARDKANLDIFWLKDESLEASENLPDPDVIAAEIAEDLRAALEQMEAIAADLA